MPQSANQRNGRQRFAYRNRVQQNTAGFDLARTVTVTFCSALAIGRRFATAQPQAQPDQGLNEIKQGGINCRHSLLYDTIASNITKK